MCGIIAYLGNRWAVPILIDGLKRLEYRGYDSAGVAVLDGDLRVVRAKGEVKNLEHVLGTQAPPGTVGIAHTRWATHGEPSETNAHPQRDCRGKIAVVHNGIFENAAGLRLKLQERGHQLASETDTELLAHLIEEAYEGDLLAAVREALRLVHGTYGIAVLHVDHPRMIVGARLGSPLLVASRNGERFLASDAKAVSAHTPPLYYLRDGEMVVLSDQGEGYVVTSIADGAELPRVLTDIEWDLEKIELGGHESHMHAEIHQQPQVVINACRGRLHPESREQPVRLGGLEGYHNVLRRTRHVYFVGCGSSYFAAQIGAWFLKRYARVRAYAEQASVFRSCPPLLMSSDVVFVLSQSGETRDTLLAVLAAKQAGAQTFGIVNVVGSTIAREAGKGMYLLAGPEIAVASTKAFVSQVTVLGLLTLLFGLLRKKMRPGQVRQATDALAALPGKIEQVLAQEEVIRTIAEVYAHRSNALFIGRGALFPVALEGALKLKEISYVHAEGYEASEMKHGPIALIDENMPVIVVAPRDPEYEKIVGNVEEVRARKGRIIAVVTDGDEAVKAKAHHVITIPETAWIAAPVLATIPLQLYAYHVARLRGIPPEKLDRPRNLAKSVTVE